MLQSEELRASLLARYPPEKLFQAERNFNAAQDLDVSLLEGDLVGVIKKKDPMGSQNRWLIDNGGKSSRGQIVVVWLLSCILTFCDPMDCSLPGFSVHGILQARILEWVAMPSLQGTFPTQGLKLCLRHWQANYLLLSHQGSPDTDYHDSK